MSCLHVTPHNLCDTSDVVRQARNAAYRIGTLWLETQFDEARASVFEGFGDCGVLAITLWVSLFIRSLNLRGRKFWNSSKRGGRKTKKRSRKKKTQLSAKSRYAVHCHETLVFGIHDSLHHVHQRLSCMPCESACITYTTATTFALQQNMHHSKHNSHTLAPRGGGDDARRNSTLHGLGVNLAARFRCCARWHRAENCA